MAAFRAVCRKFSRLNAYIFRSYISDRKQQERREKANERNLEDTVNRKTLVSLGVYVVTLVTAASVLAQTPPVQEDARLRADQPGRLRQTS